MQYEACVRCTMQTMVPLLEAGICRACRRRLEQIENERIAYELGEGEDKVPPPPQLSPEEIREKAEKRIAEYHAQRTEEERAARERIEASARAEMEHAAALAARAQEKENEKLRERREKEKIQKEARDLHKQEMARRVLSRRHLIAYIQKFNPDYQAGWFHKVVCERLEKFLADVRAGKSPRLILAAPPRHGKSMMVTEEFPSWALGKYPELEFICASYNAELATSFSRTARARVRLPEYKALFPKTELVEDSQSASLWQTTAGGVYLAAGVGGGLTGHGARILIIDDPYKNAIEAESPDHQAMVKQWYRTSALTRLLPGGGVLVMATRWADNDLSGWLEEMSASGEGDKFEVLRFPAVAPKAERFRKYGEALHPDRYPVKALQSIEKAIGPRAWAAMYQQNPVPDEGAYFKPDWLRRYRDNDLPMPETLRYYQAWDLAVGKKQANDYSVGITVALDQDENMYIVDVKRGRWTSMELVDVVLDAQVKWDAQLVGIEKGVIEMTLGPFLNKRINERRQYRFTLEEMRPGRADKQQRARSIQGRMQQGKVFFPVTAPWLSELEVELMRFPMGVHDDQVDSLAYLGLMMDTMVKRYIAPVPRGKSWLDRLKKVGSNIKTGMSA